MPKRKEPASRIPLPAMGYRVVQTRTEVDGRLVDHLTTASSQPPMMDSALPPAPSDLVDAAAVRQANLDSAPPAWSVDQVKTLVTKGFSQTQISTRLGVSVATLREGLANSKQKVELAIDRRAPPFNVRQAVAFYEAGQSVLAIARHFGVTVATIRKALRSQDIELRK